MFPFNSLPFILKNSILEAVDLEDSLKFLQINSNFREYLLRKGVFRGQKVKEIHLSSANSSLISPANSSLISPANSSLISSKSDEEETILVPTLKLEISTKGSTVTFDSTANSSSFPIKTEHSKLFNQILNEIRIIESIQITLPIISTPKTQKKSLKYFDFLDFLPKFRQIRKFSLNLNNFFIFQRFFSHFVENIDDTFRLFFVKNDLKEEETEILNIFFKNHLNKTKCLQLNVPIAPFIAILNNKIEKNKKKCELFVEFCEKWDHFIGSVEPLLCRGFASFDSFASFASFASPIAVAFHLKHGPSRWNSGFLAVQNWLSTKHEMTGFHEHSVEALEMVAFFDELVQKRLSSGKAERRLEQKAFFRKTLLGRRGELSVMASVLDTNQLFVLLRCL